MWDFITQDDAHFTQNHDVLTGQKHHFTNYSMSAISSTTIVSPQNPQMEMSPKMFHFSSQNGYSTIFSIISPPFLFPNDVSWNRGTPKSSNFPWNEASSYWGTTILSISPPFLLHFGSHLPPNKTSARQTPPRQCLCLQRFAGVAAAVPAMAGGAGVAQAEDFGGAMKQGFKAAYGGYNEYIYIYIFIIYNMIYIYYIIYICIL